MPSDWNLPPQLEAWLAPVGILLASLAAWLVAYSLFAVLVRRIAGDRVDARRLERMRRPSLLALAFLAVYSSLPAFPLSDVVLAVGRRIAFIGFIASVAWAAIALVGVLESLAAERWRFDVQDNLGARQLLTRFAVLRRIANAIIVVLALALVLLAFPSIRSVGLGLLGSAGLAGLVLGLAARPALSNLIAGVQIAFAQPIRLDDVVIVEGQWGRIEEIGSTFVVVRIWDQRRLIVPLSHFIEKPFENWTRTTADLLGTVYLYCDYAVPVDEVRKELRRILEATELWDRRAWGLQVTDTTERTVQLRALMSASNASAAWELRCHVREALVGFLQERYPESLPRTRAIVEAHEGTSERGQLAVSGSVADGG